MRIIVPILSLSFFVACVGLSFHGFNTAAACPLSNSASLSQPGSFTTGGDRFFSFEATGTWHTKATPTNGIVQLGTSSTFYVHDVSISPAYFFPTSCESSLQHSILGQLDSNRTVGGVELTFDVGPTPNNANAGGFTTICYLNCP